MVTEANLESNAGHIVISTLQEDKYIDLLRVHGGEIKNQSEELIKLINTELN